MDQKLFLEKITEVADWHWEQHRGSSTTGQGYVGEDGEAPTYIHIDKFKSKPCPYQEDKKDCYWKIYKRGYSGYAKVLIQKCDTCGAIKTPKRHYIANPEGYNYPKIVRDADSEE